MLTTTRARRGESKGRCWATQGCTQQRSRLNAKCGDSADHCHNRRRQVVISVQRVKGEMEGGAARHMEYKAVLQPTLATPQVSAGLIPDVTIQHSSFPWKPVRAVQHECGTMGDAANTEVFLSKWYMLLGSCAVQVPRCPSELFSRTVSLLPLFRVAGGRAPVLAAECPVLRAASTFRAALLHCW